MASAHKESLSSTSTRNDPIAPVSLDHSVPQRPKATCKKAWGDAYPPSVPTRPAYLLARCLGLLFALLNIGLASAAIRMNRPTWSTPIYSPAFTSLFNHGMDIFYVLRVHRRAPRWWRMLYNCALGIGFFIALGFLASFTNDDLQRTRPDSSQATAGVAAAILCGMAVEGLLHLGISAGAVVETLRQRTERRCSGNPHTTNPV